MQWQLNFNRIFQDTIRIYRSALGFYKMFLETESDTTCKLKVLHNNDWIWITVNLLKTEVSCILPKKVLEPYKTSSKGRA